MASRLLIVRELLEGFFSEFASHHFDHTVCDKLLLLCQFDYLPSKCEYSVCLLQDLKHVSDVFAL